MRTFHLHIQGRVQGVGFRPYVYKVAREDGLNGTVRNDTDGVHVIFNTADEEAARDFQQRIVHNAPAISIIQQATLFENGQQQFNDFSIAESDTTAPVRLLITPDLATCPDCKSEMQNSSDRRYQYAFITCTNCGPRYSIINRLPYDRPHTTMDSYQMCPDCHSEYHDITDRRHYSQTNSCPSCPVLLTLVDAQGKTLDQNQELAITRTCEAIDSGRIVAIKGIGGYLLVADATNADVVRELRRRKKRPGKPFAVMYPSLSQLQLDARLSDGMINALQSPESPIVLTPLRTEIASKIALDEVAPKLGVLGVMLPYTGLYEMILNRIGKPVVATSGNVSDSPIIFNDDQAIKELGHIADLILINDREVVVPQDDSVLRFSPVTDSRIIIRRSRGIAPAVTSHPFHDWQETVFAAGADLKSTFGLFYNSEVYLSQYLGNLEYLGAQESYRHTVDHFNSILDCTVSQVLADKHPGYFSTTFAELMEQDRSIHKTAIQHHEAHFMAILAEANLLQASEPVLGVVLDGTGFGTDGNIWGGEFFDYSDQQVSRIGHIDYFHHLYGDKMSKEPRISALSLFRSIPGGQKLLRSKFNDLEWSIYMQDRSSGLLSSSAGRIFDAVSCMLGLCDVMTYEGQAALLLELEATEYLMNNADFTDRYEYELSNDGLVIIKTVFEQILHDIEDRLASGAIALKFHNTMACAIRDFAATRGYRHVAFTGGVFQNALLVDRCKAEMNTDYVLHFHEMLSPNDENIAFGQLAWAYLQR